MNIQEKRARYLELCHAMQTGVAAKMGKDGKDVEPKHLRVGINVAIVDHAALVNLLFKKGIISADEYYDALIEGMEREVENYRQLLHQLYDAEFTLI